MAFKKGQRWDKNLKKWVPTKANEPKIINDVDPIKPEEIVVHEPKDKYNTFAEFLTDNGLTFNKELIRQAWLKFDMSNEKVYWFPWSKTYQDALLQKINETDDKVINEIFNINKDD